MNYSNLYFLKIDVIFNHKTGLNLFIEKRIATVIIINGTKISILFFL